MLDFWYPTVSLDKATDMSLCHHSMIRANCSFCDKEAAQEDQWQWTCVHRQVRSLLLIEKLFCIRIFKFLMTGSGMIPKFGNIFFSTRGAGSLPKVWTIEQFRAISPGDWNINKWCGIRAPKWWVSAAAFNCRDNEKINSPTWIRGLFS